MRGIGPPASRSQTERSTDELHPDKYILIVSEVKLKISLGIYTVGGNMDFIVMFKNAPFINGIYSGSFFGFDTFNRCHKAKFYFKITTVSNNLKPPNCVLVESLV